MQPICYVFSGKGNTPMIGNLKTRAAAARRAAYAAELAALQAQKAALIQGVPGYYQTHWKAKIAEAKMFGRRAMTLFLPRSSYDVAPHLADASQSFLEALGLRVTRDGRRNPWDYHGYGGAPQETYVTITW